MNNDDKHAEDVVNPLKSGAVLVKRKINGKKYPRQFFLHEHEDFISYSKSRRIFGHPRICKYEQKKVTRCKNKNTI